MAYINIALCDDDKVLCGELETILIKVLQADGIKYNIDSYYSGEQLLEPFKDSFFPYDLIFLDIELPNLTGMDIGKYIRNEMSNHKTEIAFISSNSSYSLDLFKFRPIDFLVKPITIENTAHVINTFMAHSNQIGNTFLLQKNKTTFSIPQSDILYFEHLQKKTILHSLNKTLEFYDSLDKVSEQLTDNFILVHKSFIVNYRYIFKFNNKTLTLTDGTEIPISQSKRNEVQEKFAELRMQDIK